jgi:uncharacterized damage-inducible protein DinB
MSSRELTELLRGKGAHVDPIACLEDISADLAAQHAPGYPHSIGQLVFHMSYWMDYDLRRARGEKPPYPKHNAESFPSEPTPADAHGWDEMRKRFVSLIEDCARLAQASAEELAREASPTHPTHQQRANTLAAILWQTVAHNSYHAGQIAMIRRALGAWPPRSGGDTW